VGEVSDADKAARLVGVVQARLQETPFTTIAASLMDGSEVTTAFPPYDRDADPVVPNTARVFFASEDGAIVAPYGAITVWGQNGTLTAKKDRDALKYFELTLVRNEALSDSDNDDSAGFLAFNIRVRWPAFLPNGEPVTDNTQKEVLIIPAAITR
jgi:hypothetical protein